MPGWAMWVGWVTPIRVASRSWTGRLFCEDRLLVLTNLDGGMAHAALQRERSGQQRTIVVLGDRELGESLDRNAGARMAMPSVLGLRDLSSLVTGRARARSSLDVERAQALARVFWPTRAYSRARDVLARHRFVVLTGPPEMGKTAIAQMLALAQMTTGWEAHESSSPGQLWRVFDRKRRQGCSSMPATSISRRRRSSCSATRRPAARAARLAGCCGAPRCRSWSIRTSRPSGSAASSPTGSRRCLRSRSRTDQARNLAAYLLNAIARGGTSGIGRCPCSWWRAGMRCANGLPGSSSHPRWASAGLSCTPDHLRPAGWTDSSERRWWEPEDIPTPPTTDPALTAPAQFTRQDVDRVLRDL